MVASSDHWKRVWAAIGSKFNTRLFRNNTGSGWVGQSKQFKKNQTVQVQAGDVLVRNARPLHAGLMKGSADGIGWKTVTITPDMVGQKVAIFLSVEAKYRSGRLSDEQQVWHNNVRDAGGISIVARSPEQAVEDLQQLDLLSSRNTR